MAKCPNCGDKLVQLEGKHKIAVNLDVKKPINIRWNTPKFGNEEKQELMSVMDSGFVSEGPLTKEAEEQLSHIVNAKHVILTTSCTAALYLAIEADKRIKGYTKGSVVIPDLTFVGTKNAVELAGLVPDVQDVDEEFLLTEFSATLGHTKIIMPVNLLGRTVNIPEHQVSPFTLICDNAGCLGSFVQNGKVGCYSLQANKLVNCGQGGFCATDDDEYARVIRELKDFGRSNKDQNCTIGFNFKFNDIQAAVVLGQLAKITKKENKLRYQYSEYKDKLSNLGKFMNYSFTSGQLPLWMEFFPNDGTRDELHDYLKENGIETRKPWKPFLGLKNSTYYYENCLWLPSGDSISEEDIDEVIRKVKDFYGHNS